MTGKRVLAAEHEAVVQLILAEILENKGFQAAEAGTGGKAARPIDGPGGLDPRATDFPPRRLVCPPDAQVEASDQPAHRDARYGSRDA